MANFSNTKPQLLLRQPNIFSIFKDIWGILFLLMRSASLVTQMVKSMPAMQENRAVCETWVRFLGQKDPLEEEATTHSSVVAWEVPWTEEPGDTQSLELQRVRHN